MMVYYKLELNTKQITTVFHYDLTLYYKTNLHNLLHLCMKGRSDLLPEYARKTDYFSLNHHHLLNNRS